MSTERITTPPGLNNVAVTDTQIGDVRGDEGYYHYRQYSATDLARSHNVEEVWHLLFTGQLPNAEEYAAWHSRIADARVLPEPVQELLPSLVQVGGEPITVLRTALSLLGAHLDLPHTWECPRDQQHDAALKLAAAVPTLLAAIWRLQHNQQPIAPSATRDHAADYLHMLTGNEPDPRDAQAIRSYLVSTMDHGFNASTFTARVVASAGADVAACLVGALGTFTGPLHGGAPGKALAALHEIGALDNADAWVRSEITSGRRIMGFGHSVYRVVDPRSELLKSILSDYDTDLARLAIGVEQVVNNVMDELKPGKKLRANVEYYAGVVMSHAGIDEQMATPTFCVARAIGWAANILEQTEGRKIFRPAATYVGPTPPVAVPDSVASYN